MEANINLLNRDCLGGFVKLTRRGQDIVIAVTFTGIEGFESTIEAKRFAYAVKQPAKVIIQGMSLIPCSYLFTLQCLPKTFFLLNTMEFKLNQPISGINAAFVNRKALIKFVCEL